MLQFIKTIKCSDHNVIIKCSDPNALIKRSDPRAFIKCSDPLLQLQPLFTYSSMARPNALTWLIHPCNAPTPFHSCSPFSYMRVCVCVFDVLIQFTAHKLSLCVTGMIHEMVCKCRNPYKCVDAFKKERLRDKIPRHRHRHTYTHAHVGADRRRHNRLSRKAHNTTACFHCNFSVDLISIQKNHNLSTNASGPERASTESIQQQSAQQDEAGCLHRACTHVLIHPGTTGCLHVCVCVCVSVRYELYLCAYNRRYAWV